MFCAEFFIAAGKQQPRTIVGRILVVIAVVRPLLPLPFEGLFRMTTENIVK
jgi:hypothetical protein